MENYLGRLLDNRYEILEVIGTGGMAVVYKALDHRLNRLVAVKILKDEFSRNQEFRRRFHAESQAVAMLSHPNIVSVYDVSRSGDVDYIVMELIEGITLKQYLEKKGCLNWRETLHFAMHRPIWKPMHMQPMYRMNSFVTVAGEGRARTNAYIAGGVEDVGADIFDRGLCLPSDNKMTAEEQDRIIEVIRRCFE